MKTHLVFSIILLFKLVIFIEFVQSGATGLLESGVSPFYHIISNPNHLKPSFTDGGSIFNPNLRPNFAPVKGKYIFICTYIELAYLQNAISGSI